MNLNKIKIGILNRKNLIKAFRNPVSALKAYKKLLERKHRFIELIDLVFDAREEYERYLEEVQNDKIANEITEKISTLDAGNIPRNCMFTIYSIIRKTKPKIVIETGVAYGYSTTFILLALEKNNKGRLYSIDIDENAG